MNRAGTFSAAGERDAAFEACHGGSPAGLGLQEHASGGENRRDPAVLGSKAWA